MKTKWCFGMLAVFAALLFASPVYAQKKGGGGKGGHDGGRKSGHQKNRDHQSDNHRSNDRHRNDNDRRHPHYWGGPGWNWYAGTSGVGFYYGPRYTSCYNYYYPVAPWRPVAYQPWTHYYYFYGSDPCPIHKYIHHGYCEYYYDDNGGLEVFYFYPQPQR